MSEGPKKRRWFRWSLRTMFVVVTLFCVWLGYHLNWIRQRHAVARRDTVISKAHGPEYDVSALFGLRMLGELGPKFVVVHFYDDRRAKSSFEWSNAEARQAFESRLTESEQQETERIRRLFPEASVYAQIASERSNPTEVGRSP